MDLWMKQAMDRNKRMREIIDELDAISSPSTNPLTIEQLNERQARMQVLYREIDALKQEMEKSTIDFSLRHLK